MFILVTIPFAKILRCCRSKVNINSPKSHFLFLSLLPSVISVTRPLDYEQVPKGMVYLTVMAKDGGNPALNSTVPVTVEVIVSTTLQNMHGNTFNIKQRLLVLTALS